MGFPKKISQLPLNSNLQPEDLLITVNENDVTTKIRLGQVFSFITGSTNTYVTGGTYNDITKNIDFDGNSGFPSFSVSLSGISTTDTFVTGATLNGFTLEIDRNNGDPQITVDLSPLTGDTDTNTFVSGSTLVGDLFTLKRNDDVDITTDFNPLISGKLDTTVFNTYSGLTQTEINNKLNVTTFDSYTANTTDNVVTGATLVGTTLELERNNGLSNVSVNLSSLTGDTDTNTFVTGSTLVGDTLIIRRNDNFNIITNLNPIVSGKVDTTLFDTYSGLTQTEINNKLNITTFDSYTANTTDNVVTGATLVGTTLELERNNGLLDVTVDLSSIDTNVFVNSGNANVGTQQLTFTNTSGGTFNVTNATSLFSDNDINVTGGTYNPNTGCVGFVTNSGTTFDVCGFVTGLTDTFISGTTLVGTNYTLERTDGVNITTDFSSIVSGKLDTTVFNTYSGLTQTEINNKLNVTTFDSYTANTTDNVVTGATLVGTTLELERNNGLSNVSVNLSSLTGSTDTNTFVSGTTLVGDLFTLKRNDDVGIITNLSPIVSGKVGTTLFDSYTADTQTEINNKLNVTTFDSYTANTTDNVVTGATLVGTTLELERNNGLSVVNVDLSSLTGDSDTNTFVTGATLTNATLDIERNDGVGVSVDLSSLTGGTVSNNPYTIKSGGNVINWDYLTDGPNIKVSLSGDASNIITVDSVSEFPNGTSGFIIIDPSLSTDYKLPDEDYGSDSGIKSYLSDASAALGGSNPVRLQYTYDGTNFWFDKFTNMIEPIYPPSVEFDTTDLIAFYHPESFNQAISGVVSAGFAVPNISSSILIGDLAIGTDVTDFDFTVRDDSISQPAFWTLGDDENEIITPSTLGATIDTNNTVSFYMKGPYQIGYCGLIDFYDGSGIFEETLYLYNSEFKSYDPSFTFSYPELLDYSANGGADLTSEWLFITYSIDETSNELTLYVGCQSSLDAARAASGATNWDYSGLGDTVSIDSAGLYKETTSVTIDETTFDRFYYGNSAGGSEGALCNLGMLGIYSSVIPDSRVESNWESTRSTYYIT